MIIIGILLFGMLVGAGAQLILGEAGGRGVDWGSALASGLAGSFLGGLIVSLVAGDGFHLRPSGVIGSLLGALIVTAAWRWWRARSA